MDLLAEALNEEWQVLVRFAPRLLVALTVFLTSFVLGRVFGRGIVHLLSRGQFSGPHKAFFRSLSTWIFVVFGAAAALSVLGLQGLATSLVAGGGVTAIVLGFAFRQIGENFLAGFFLAFSRPFELDTFQENVNLGRLRNEVMENSRQALFSNSFTVSANVASSVELVGGAPIDIRLRQGGPSGLGPQSDSVRE